jgi:hypothetical protein
MGLSPIHEGSDQSPGLSHPTISPPHDISQKMSDYFIVNNSLNSKKIELYEQSIDITTKSNQCQRLIALRLKSFIKSTPNYLNVWAQPLFDYLQSIAQSHQSTAQSHQLIAQSHQSIAPYLQAIAPHLQAIDQSLKVIAQSLQATPESRERACSDLEPVDKQGGDNDQNESFPSSPRSINDPFYHDVITQFNSNDISWLNSENLRGKFKKVNITTESAQKKDSGYAREIANFELGDEKAPFLIYEADEHIWLIPNKADKNWPRAVTQTLFTGNSANSLIRPAEVESYADNSWKIKQKGEFE